jgi:hypothetical protein
LHAEVDYNINEVIIKCHFNWANETMEK